MSEFDSRYWNLTQASAWVVYRDRKLVEQFSCQSPNGWKSLNFYSTMPKYKRIGELDKLVANLTQGNLTAWGYRNNTAGKLEAIPSIEWTDLQIRPPSIKRSHPKSGQFEPWTNLTFESSALKKLWRGLTETEDRTRFKWDVLEKMWEKIKERLPDASENEKIVELQLIYKKKYSIEPARSTIQGHIKRWEGASQVG